MTNKTATNKTATDKPVTDKPVTDKPSADKPVGAEQLNNSEKLYLPEFLGIRIADVEPGKITATLQVQQQHLAPNGYLHAGAVVTLADTACGGDVRGDWQEDRNVSLHPDDSLYMILH